MKILLLALLLAAFATVRVWQRSTPREPQRVVVAPVREAMESPANRRTVPTDPAAAPTPQLDYRTPWEAVKATNVPAFVRLLRLSGCPEETVRLWALAAVGRSVQDRLEAPLRREVQASKWWQASDNAASRALSVTLRQARQELDDTLLRLVGQTAESLRNELAGALVPQDPWLPQETRQHLDSLLNRHRAEIEEIESRSLSGALGQSLSPELRAELRAARERHRDDLRVALGPELYAQYLVRESAEANFVRWNLPEAQNESDFRLMVQAAVEVGVESTDVQLESISRHIPADAFPDPIRRPREEVLARFRELSSPERVEELERDMAAEQERKAGEERAEREQSTLNDLQRLTRVGGAEITPDEARQIKIALEKRSEELNKEWSAPPPNPTDAERRELEDRLAAELEAVVTPIIGERSRALIEGMRQESRRRR